MCFVDTLFPKVLWTSCPCRLGKYREIFSSNALQISKRSFSCWRMEYRWRASSTSAGAAQALWCLTLLAAVQWAAVANVEGDALHALRRSLIDPSQVLQSWDPSLPYPCTWFHITCNLENHVVRVDLGNASLSGSLVPQLGELSKLQYLEIFGNNISGPIPESLGNLSQLISLDLFQNSLTGSIPASLGELSQLRFLRLERNTLTGAIPGTLPGLANLLNLDLSYNNLSGDIPVDGSFSRFTYKSFDGNPYLHYALAPAPAPGAC